MSAELDPRIRKKIEAFAGRRRELITLRGICALVVLLLVTMTGLALLDRAIVLPDQLRWVLSLAAYAAVGVVVWRLGLRQLFGKPSRREIARLVEHAEPSLREDLISAIELGAPRDAVERHDSERFRELVQDDVGARADGIDVAGLLPLGMLSKWMRGALAAVVLVVLLALVPGLHFGQMFARALLPGVDLARPSNLKIEFLEPDPADRIVPANEAVAVRVAISGGDVDRAELEAREKGGRTEKIRLTRERGNQFSGSLMVKREDVEYRVRSGGAITSFHTLESRGRPRIVSFSKTYHPPTYTAVPQYTEETDHGDLSGFEGTRVSLALEPDQGIESGELRLQASRDGEEDLTLPLGVDEDGKLTAEVTITADHSLYRVHLVAAESGFTNVHSPDYEIRAVADLKPELQITQPANNQEIRNDGTIGLQGIARDDVGLAEVKQAYRINRSDWREIVLHTDCGTEQLIDHSWSLRGVGARPGDILVVKLVGTDSGGATGESNPIRLLVTGWEDDPSKRAWAEKEKSVASQAKRLAQESREMAEAVQKAKDALKKEPGERSLEDQQAVVRAEDETAQANAKAEQVLEEVKQALAEAPSRAEAEEMQAAAEALADFKNQNLERVADQVEAMAAGEKEEPQDGNHRPQHLAWEAAQRAEKLQQALGRIAAEDNAELAAEDAGRLEDRQEEIAAEAREMPAGDEGEAEVAVLKEEQEVAAAQAESLEEDLRDLAEMLDGGERNQAESAAQRLDEQGKKLEEALAKDDIAQNLPQEAQRMEKRLEDVERAAQSLEQQTARLAEQAREELFRNQDPASKAIEEAKWLAEQLANESRDLEQNQAGENANPQQLENQQAAIEDKGEQLEELLDSVAEQFEDLADVEDASPVGEPQRAAELSQVARALDELADESQDAAASEEAQRVAEDLAKLQEAVEAMEAGEKASDLAEALAELARAEKADGAEENADDWNVAEKQLKELPEDVGRVEESAEAQRQAQQAANSPQARALENEMAQREQAAARNDENRQPGEMAQDVENLQEQVEGVAEKLQPAVEQARQDVAELAPSVPEMLRDLADEVGAQQEATQQLAENALSSEPGETAEKAQDLAGQNEATSERLEEAMDALRHEANAEDILSEEGRERARDADDAAAQLAQAGADQAQQQLDQAAASQDPQQQADGLEAAARDQGELADALNELADNLEGLDQGESIAEAAREALREMEQQLGVEETLSDAFDQAENLADLMAAAGQDPAAALEALESELQQNPAMQEALQQLSQDLVAEAAGQMERAAEQESQVGEQLAAADSAPAQSPPAQQAMGEAAQQQESINREVSEAGETTGRAARHEERLGNQDAAESLAELGESAQELAQTGEAAEALAAMQQPGQSPAQAAQKAASAESAIGAQAEAMQAAAQSSPQPGQGAAEPGEQAQAQMLAEALDSLDQSLAAAGQSPPGEGQASQQAQAQAQAAAQEGIAQAAAAQGKAMAQARASGEMSSPPSPTPGAQAMAAAQQGQASQSSQGARLQGEGQGIASSVTAADVDGSDIGEDWSKLPPKVAKDIIEAQRQGVAPEYRSAIENYYKAIADRARMEKKP